MWSRKEFIILLASILIVVIMIIFGGYFLWNNMIFGNLQKAAQNASKEAGVEINTNDSSSQGSVNSVRDMMEKIQEKKNAEMEDALKQ